MDHGVLLLGFVWRSNIVKAMGHWTEQV